LIGRCDGAHIGGISPLLRSISIRQEHGMSNLNTHENDELSRCELSGEDLDQASGGGAKDTGPKESISFNFTKIAWTYTAQDA
jgi:hypothetical protein